MGWFNKHWRPIAFYVYAGICIFDFVIMPSIIEYSNRRIDNQSAVIQALLFRDGGAQIKALDLLSDRRKWDSLTLYGAGVFHMSFGAILGAAAWTRGQQLVEATKRKNQPDNPDDVS